MRKWSELAWVLGAQVMGLVGGLVGLKLLTNFMSSSEFGVYQLGWSAALIAATAIFNPIGQAIIRLEPLQIGGENKRRFFANNLRALAVVCVGLTLVVLASAPLWKSVSDHGVLLVIPVAIAVIGHGCSLVGQHYSTALRERVAFLINQTAIALGRPLAATAALVFLSSSGSERAAFALAGSGLFLLGYFSIQMLVVGHVLSRKPDANKQLGDVVAMDDQSSGGEPPTKTLFSVAFPMALLGCLSVFSLYSDRWIISALLDLKAVGIYAAIYQIVQAPLNFAQGIANRFSLPIIFATLGSGTNPEARVAAMKSIRTLGVIWTALMSAIMLGAVFGHQIVVRALTTEQISQYSFLLPLLLAGLALERTAQILTVRGNVEMSYWIYVPVRLLHIAILVGLGIWLIPQHGVYAFAYAQIVAGAAIVIAVLGTNYVMFTRR